MTARGLEEGDQQVLDGDDHDGAVRPPEPSSGTVLRRSLAGRCRDEGGPEALRPHYEKKQTRSVALLEEALASLERAGENKSLDSIHVRSALLAAERAARGDANEIAELGTRPIAVSTILNNSACSRIYYPRRTVDPLSEPPMAAAKPSDRRRTKRALSHDLRRQKAGGRTLLADIARIGGERARADREAIDGGTGVSPHDSPDA